MGSEFHDRLVSLFHLLRDDTHHCRCCGRCCRLFGGHLHAEPSDLDRWRREGREDLSAMVNHLGWIWCDPATGEPLGYCPFLTQEGDHFLCLIHDVRPQICRDYPPMEHWKRCVFQEPEEEK